MRDGSEGKEKEKKKRKGKGKGKGREREREGKIGKGGGGEKWVKKRGGRKNSVGVGGLGSDSRFSLRDEV